MPNKPVDLDNARRQADELWSMAVAGRNDDYDLAVQDAVATMLALIEHAKLNPAARNPELELRAKMADGCLDMIREKLVWLLGEDGMKGCPAMMYPEAIQEAVLRAARGEFDDRIPAHLRSRADHA